MKGKYGVLIVVVVVLILAFLGRHQLKSLISPQASLAPQVSTTSTPEPAMQASNSAMTMKGEIVMTKSDSKMGNYLTDSLGMTLYTYDKDAKNVSNCSGKCLAAWPAYTTKTVPSTLPTNITTFKRVDDGMTQYAWKGMPLYYYVTDKKVGDITGDGVGGVWHIIKP